MKEERGVKEGEGIGRREQGSEGEESEVKEREEGRGGRW